MPAAEDATKTRLLEAAGEEFAEKGFEGATIRSIVERARANVAAVNYHFGDKERLYTQAVIAAHTCGIDLQPDVDDEGLAPDEALRRFVRHFLERVLALGGANSWQQRLMLREMLSPSHASDSLVREVIRPRFGRLLAILRRACPDLDERRLTASAFSVIGQCLFYKVARPIAVRLIGDASFSDLDVEYLSDHIARFTLAALGIASSPCRDSAPIASNGRKPR